MVEGEEADVICELWEDGLELIFEHFSAVDFAAQFNSNSFMYR